MRGKVAQTATQNSPNQLADRSWSRFGNHADSADDLDNENKRAWDPLFPLLRLALTIYHYYWEWS